MLEDLSISRRGFLGTCVASSYLLCTEVIANPTSSREDRDRDHENDTAIRDAIKKAENFEHDYRDDLFLSTYQLKVLRRCLARLNRIQRVIGYANFNLVSFDAARKYARSFSRIGGFTHQELGFIEAIFFTDASIYGFLGKKVSGSLTDTITRRDVQKIRGSGHYLYKGDALDVYFRMQKLIGPQLQLTSGIRGVVKQLHLFMAKASKSGGNLSRAARSLAPPGHSFHGIGDFDVGQRGLGAANFTNAFARSHVYEKLTDLGMISMRYPYANPYGVRHEPWHIKVVKDV